MGFACECVCLLTNKRVSAAESLQIDMSTASTEGKRWNFRSQQTTTERGRTKKHGFRVFCESVASHKSSDGWRRRMVFHNKRCSEVYGAEIMDNTCVRFILRWTSSGNHAVFCRPEWGDGYMISWMLRWWHIYLDLWSGQLTIMWLDIKIAIFSESMIIGIWLTVIARYYCRLLAQMALFGSVSEWLDFPVARYLYKYSLGFLLRTDRSLNSET